MKVFFAILLLLVPSAVPAFGGPFANTMPEEVRWALSVREQATGEVAAGQGNSAKPLAPASLTKLWVGGAELAGGKPKSLETALLISEASGGTNTIYLQGHGNALLTTVELRQLASALTRAGVTRVQGDIVAETKFFSTEDWKRERSGSAYATPGALGLDLHTILVTARPTDSGQPPQVGIEPPNEAVRFAVAARTVAGGGSTLRIEQLDDLSYKVTGNLPLDAGAQSHRFPLQDPARYAAGTLKTVLQEAGIKVEARVRKGKTPPSAELLAKFPGPDTDKMLRAMNYHSLNVVADNLLLALGAERFGPPGTREKGIRAVEEFLESLALPMDEVEIYDGSGLSEKNRVTADFMTRYLVAATKQPWFERFRDTLPRPGHEGTAGEIGFKDERFRVKTGRLEDVYALAGYGVDGARRDVAFCFIVNGPGVGILPNMDDVGAEVLRFIAAETFHR